MEAAKKASREGIPVHKEFPEGYKWMASPDTVADAKALQYIQDVGCEGGWCTQGEELAKRYGGEGNQLFVLHDPSGKAVVQISVEPGDQFASRNRLFDVTSEQYKKVSDLAEQKLSSGTYGNDINAAMTDASNEILGLPPSSIVEIKGKQNRAPSEEYLPYIQDFVRSGKWSDVGDPKNAGLRRYGDVFNVNEQRGIEATGEAVPENDWLTGEDIQRLHNVITPEGKRLKYDARGNIIGGDTESGMRRGGPVNQDAMNMAVWDKKVQHKQIGGGMKGVKAALNAGEEILRLKAAAKAAGVLPKGQQAVLSAAESKANLEKFLALSTDKRRMYHGSKEPNIAEFKTRKDMTDESNMTGHYADERDAVFLSPEPDFTKNFSMMGYTDEGMAPTTYPVHVQVKKPFDFDNPDHLKKVKETYLDMYHNPESELFDPYMLPSERSMAVHSFNKRTDALPNDENNWARIENAQFQDVLKDVGFDSFYTRERGTKNLGVYEPNKIKSAIGNRGTYDIGESDMSKAKGGSVSQDVMRMAITNKQLRKRHG
jgi:hypothetical protein